jgi:glycosyltransferase involved in cell wall biosynthesis
MRRLRILWVTPNVPLRGVNAARERWWALLSRLALRHDVTLLTFVDPEDAGVADGLPPGLSGVERVLKRPFVPDDPLALLPRAVRGGYSDPALRAAIAARLAAERFDLVQYEFTEMANVMPSSPVPSILTVHQLGFAQEGPRWRAAGRRLGEAPAALFRHWRDLDWELRAVQQAHQIVTMSPEDADRLRRYLPDLRVAVSPVGIDCHEYRPPSAVVVPDADLLFVGHFGHPPNVDAVRFLVEDVVPRLGRAVRVRVVGHAMPPALAALARMRGVDIEGPLPDLRPCLAAAKVVVAPVRFGTGMRGKVLEALAMSRPVVTTSVGAEGLGATPGTNLLVADDAAGFADSVRRVLDDASLAARLGAAGRSLVETRFDWDTIATAHDAIYEAALGAPRPLAPPLERAARLRATLGRAGWAPGVAAGAVLVACAALRRRHALRRVSS